MRTRIKICGVTRLADVQAAADAGVDAIGLVFAPGSPRALSLEAAVALRAAVPPFVSCVALVMNQPADAVTRIVQALRPDMLQFHGDEPVDECARHRLPYIKASGFGGVSHVDDAALTRVVSAHPDAVMVLADSHAPGAAGGTGRTFDWTRAATVARQRRLMLAGGLSADNVGAAIAAVSPYAVDVSSGVESEPGIKAPERIQAFVHAVRRADAALAGEPVST